MIFFAWYWGSRLLWVTPGPETRLLMSSLSDIIERGSGKSKGVNQVYIFDTEYFSLKLKLILYYKYIYIFKYVLFGGKISIFLLSIYFFFLFHLSLSSCLELNLLWHTRTHILWFQTFSTGIPFLKSSTAAGIWRCIWLICQYFLSVKSTVLRYTFCLGVLNPSVLPLVCSPARLNQWGVNPCELAKHT